MNRSSVLFLLTALLLLGIPGFSNKAHAEDFSRYNDVTKYDEMFRKYSKRYFGPAFDWRHFKAQAITESRLKIDARSRVGAIGLMQIMPTTFEDIRKRNRYIKGSSRDPRWNIAAAVFYNRGIWNLFRAERPFRDRLDFTFGAYNAGKGNIIKAQKLAEQEGLNPNLWESVAQTLPQVTGKHSRETLGYVHTIKRIQPILE